ncbi:hypothetical protein niasHT_018180 [Heterodera trifolii]|uniref:Uncharacterized protein n=1 Tax=Heterodera trifolii TaxID=157864 RepID=A0ABD2LGU9_9BILA
MAAFSALLLLLPMLLNVQKIPDECVRSDMDAVYSAISALGPWKSQAETLAQICSQLSIAQAALLVKMHWEFLESNQNGREAKAPAQFDLAFFAEALEATVEMDDEGKEVKLRWEKLNEWATKMWEKAEKEGDKAEKHADKAESEGDKAEKTGDKAEKEGEKAEKHANKAEKEADEAENEVGKAEKEGDEEEEEAPKGGEMPETFTKAELKVEENGEKEEKKDPGGEVRMKFRRRKDENGNEEVVVTFVKKMEENGGPSKREEEEELEEELRKEEMVPKLDKEKGINANSAVPMVQEFNMVTNRTNTSSKSGANLDKPADKKNGISANLARPVVPKADTANDNSAKPAIPMVPELDMITNNSSNSDANLAKPVRPKVGLANDNNAKPTMPIMIPDIFLPSQRGKLSAFEKAHERRKMLKKSLSNRSFRRQKRETAGMENAVENVVSVKDEQQQIFVSIEKMTTLGMMGDGLDFLTKVTNLEIVVAKAGKKQQAKAVPSSDSMAVNWTGERDRTENGGTNWTVERGETESGADTVARVGTENEETNWTVERDGTENESDILSNLTVEQIGTENGKTNWVVTKMGLKMDALE